MTTILDFIKISRVEEVGTYTLVSDQGKRLAGNSERTDSFFKELAQLGKDVITAPTRKDLPAFTAFSIRGKTESLIVVPVGRFVLGVTPATGCSEELVTDRLLSFLERIRHQHTVSQKS